MPLLQPEAVADRVVDAIRRDERMVLMPPIVRTVPALRALLPWRAVDALADLLGGTHSLDTWRGRGS